MFQIGDHVAVIDENIEGIILDVSGDQVVIETLKDLVFHILLKKSLKQLMKYQ